MKRKLLFLLPLLFLSACTQAATQEGSVLDSSSEQMEVEQPNTAETPQTADSVEVSEEPEDEKVESADSRYVNYSAEFAAELDRPHVIFFHANWCSWCRRMEKDILEQIDTFPEEAVILKANFDEELDLRQQYGVVNKDTYVFLDGQGNTVATKSGATLEDLQEFFTSNEVIDEVVENPTGVAMYREYDAEVEETFVGKKQYALFFHADWCPTCRAADEEIKANLDDFSSSVAIFKADYDSELDLRKEYGVTSQHTLVHIDALGEVTEVVAGFSLEDIERVFSQ